MQNHYLKTLALACAMFGTALVSANAANVNLTASDASTTSSLNSAGTWSDFLPPAPANDYFTSTFFMRTPEDTNNYTFAGNSLTLQAPAGQSAPMRSIIYKGKGGNVYTINNLTNAGGIINSGAGNVAAPTFTGNQMTVISNSTIQADQGSFIIGYPIYGSANLTNTGASGNSGKTVTYTGNNSGFTGRFILPGAFPDILVFGSMNAVPGNPSTPTPNQIDLGAGTALQDNLGISLTNSNGGITLSGNATIQPNTAGSNTVISVPITGNFTLTKSGAGTLTLAGANTFSNLTLSGATAGSRLNINSSTALGVGTFTITSGDNATIDNTSGAPLTLTANNPMAWNNNFTFAGSTNLNLGAGAVSMPGGRTITVNANTLTVGGVISGGFGLTKVGGGTLALGGANTYTGTTTVNGGTLLVNGSLSTNTVAVNSGSLGGTGTIAGITTVSGNLAPGAGGAGTLAFGANLSFSSGSATFELSTTAASGNDKVTVAGNLSLSSSDAIHISALSGAANLEAANYVLFAVTGTTTMTTTPTLVWDGTPPANYLHYNLAKVGNNVVLQYTASTAPSVAVTVAPASAARNQSVTLTAVVTPGSGSIVSVTADLTTIGGSSAASLVLSNANVYTNTFVVGAATTVGVKTLGVTVTDNTSPVALTGSGTTSLTVTVGSKVWDGGSLVDNNWSSNPNWTGDTGPAYTGDSVTFAGTTRLTPNMDTNYSVTGVTFNSGAGSFAIGTTSSTLTLTSSNGIVNNSANAQALNVPLAISAQQTVNAAAGNVTLGGAISGTGGLTKTGGGTLTLTGSNSFTGNFFAKAGTVVIDTGGTNSTTVYASIGQDGADTATLTLKGTGAFSTTADFNVGDIGSSAGTLNIQNNAYLDVNALFVGSANASGSSATGTVYQTGGTVVQQNTNVAFFVIGGRNAASTNGVGIYNLSGGTAIAKSPIRMSGYGSATVNQSGGTFVSASTSGGINLQRFSGPGGTYNLDGGVAQFNNIDASVLNTDPTFHSVFNFNGGTLQPTATRSGFMPAHLSRANVRNGGAIIDTAGFDVTIDQALEHSDIGGDNATDGGLTKLGAGTLTLGTSYSSYTGPTKVRGGTLSLSPSYTPYLNDLTVSNATLKLAVNSGAFYANSVTFAGTSALNLDYGQVYYNPSSAAISSSGALVRSGTVTINITAVGLQASPTPIPLISYSGAAVTTNNFVLGNLPAGIVAHLSDSGSSLDLVITSSGQLLTWYGSDAGGVTVLTNWNIGTSSNWYDATFSTYGLRYLEYGNFGDNVAFGDAIANYDATNVNITTTVKPATLLVNSALDYNFTGAGSIAGAAALVKSNSGSLFLATSNSYTGGTIINGGTVVVTNNNALGNVTNSVTLNGGALQLNGSVTNSRSVNVTAGSMIGVAASTSSALSGGLSGSGELSKTGDGTLSLGGSNVVGQFNVDSGVVNVTGTLEANGGGGRIRVGRNAGIGVLNVPTGAVVTANYSLAPGSDTSTGTVNVNGGTLVHQGGLNIYLGSGASSSSTGILNLVSGTISNLAGGIIIGEGNTDVGVYNQYSGIGVLGGDLTVGQSAAANQLNILGGTATATNLYVGWYNGTGTATVSGGSLSLSGEVVVGRAQNSSSTGVGVLTITNGILNSENDLTIGFAGSGTETGRVNVATGGILNVASTTKRWLIAKRYDSAVAELNVNGGTINLNADTDLRMSTGNGTGASTVNLNSGAITAYSGNQTGSGSTAVVDLNNALAGANDTFNLNGGTLTIGGIVAGNTGGTRVFNFNGGTLRPTLSSMTFFDAGVASAANVLSGGAIIDTAGNDITIGQSLLDGGGGLTKNGAGTLALNGANTYTGATTVNAGSLGGTGVISGPVTLGSLATLAPGASIGTLTVSNNLSFAGNVSVEVDKSVSPSNDLCVVTGTLTNAGSGTVTVTNLGTSLVVGDTFKLFSKAVVNGNVLTIAGVSGVTWTNKLAVDGTIGVLSVGGGAPTPTLLTNSYSGGLLSLSWPAGQGWRLQSQVTNRSVGLNTNWVYITDSSVSSTNITPDKTNGTVFYRLVYP